MIRIFKKLYIGYIISIIVLLIVILADLALNLIYGDENLVFFIVMLCMVAELILLVVITPMALYKHNKLVIILNDRCDAVGFINAYRPLAMRKTDKRTRALVLTNLAIGYISAGDMASARNALASIDITNISDRGTQFSYYAAWTAVFENEDDIPNALRTAEFMK